MKELKNLDFFTIQERIIEITQVTENYDILTEYYDGNLSAYSFENFIIANNLASFLAILKDAVKSNKNLIISERSYASTRVFVDCLLKMGKISKAQHALLNLQIMYSIREVQKFCLISNIKLKEAVIYLKTDFETQKLRIKNRSRQSEKNIDFDYLQTLNETYLSYCIKLGWLVVDATPSVQNVLTDTLKIIKKLESEKSSENTKEKILAGNSMEKEFFNMSELFDPKKIENKLENYFNEI